MHLAKHSNTHSKFTITIACNYDASIASLEYTKAIGHIIILTTLNVKRILGI